MILYHFTCEQHLPSILANGLNRGEVAISPDDVVNAVWFTSDDTPDGHGLGNGREMTDAERASHGRFHGCDIPPGTRWADKGAVRIKVVIPSSDRRLVTWWKWGRKYCDREWYDVLNRLAPRYKNHFMYFGIIKPDRFVEIRREVTAASDAA